MNLKSMAMAAALGVLLTGGAARAANCSIYANGASADRLSTAKVTLNGVEASGCYGHVAIGEMGNNGVGTVVNYANALPTLFGDTWSGILRAETEETFGVHDGLEFAITGLDFSAEDLLFTLSIRDLDAGALPSLALTMDLLIGLKGSDYADFFYFDDLALTGSNNGAYTMAIANKKGVAQDLSDITLMGRNIRSAPQCPPGDPQCTPTAVPEPATLLLASVALFAAGLASRRRG